MGLERENLNFIEEIIEEDLKNGKHGSRIHTRFPPEPNGYLHIGHAKAIFINFEIAKKYGGKTNLRFDDTNPVTEDTEYVDSIKNDIQWLGYNWEGEALFASNYFDQLYEFAEDLIKRGLAYVDASSPEEIAEMKGTPTKAGVNSPYRDRTVEENLDYFRRMKAGEFEDGAMVLRAKVDMASNNMLMRDPIMYRIKHASHHNTGDKWCIYPMYDFAHGQSDSIENITHSLCSLEFIHHRPLYNWFIENLEIFPSRQIEFARMNVAYMITSKRRLLRLINENYVSGWDDPRMSTLSGMRRRGYLAESIRRFCDVTGVAKRDNLIEMELLEAIVREDLNKIATRVMVVTDPVKLIIENYDSAESEVLESVNNPEDENSGTHKMSFGREIYIERGDFMVDPPKKYFRLAPDKYVRLKGAYIIKAESYEMDAEGNITEIRCTYVPNSKSGQDESGIKVKGTIHWVDANNAEDVELRLYDRLFTETSPLSHEDKDFLEFYNEESLIVNNKAKAETYLKQVGEKEALQFMRKGYFIKDSDSTEDTLVFNRTVSLRDSWAKKQKKS